MFFVKQKISFNILKTNFDEKCIILSFYFAYILLLKNWGTNGNFFFRLKMQRSN